MSDDRLWQIVELAKKHFKQSDVGKWLADQWRDLGPALKILRPSELRRISKAVFDEIVEELGELDPFTVEQARALIQAAKEHWKQSDVAKWTGEQLRKLGSLVKGLNIEEIKRLSGDLFKEAVSVWGERLDLPDESLKALAQKAKEVFVQSDATKFVAEQLKMLGRIVLGLTPEDLEKLKIDNVDVVAALGKWKGWTKEQVFVQSLRFNYRQCIDLLVSCMYLLYSLCVSTLGKLEMILTPIASILKKNIKTSELKTL